MSFEEPKFEIPPEKEEAEEKFEEERRELSPEEKELAKELVPEIIDHPLIERGLAKYEIFSKYYFEGLERSEKEELEKEGIKPPSSEKIKERADWVLKEDPIYKIILESEKPMEIEDLKENKDFIEYVGRELKREGLDELKRAKEESKEKFNETLRKILINKQIEKEIKGKEGAERIGNMWVEVVDDECCPHLPRVAEDWPKTLRIMKEGYLRLAELLQTDKRFETVKRLEGMSWLFGQERIAQERDRIFGWYPYSEKEIEKFSKENPEAYEEIQKVGIRVSPSLFRRYLLRGERGMPKIGGRWITKEEFLEKMDPKRFLEFEKITKPSEDLIKTAENLRGETDYQTVENILTFLGENLKYVDLEKKNPKEWKKLFRKRPAEKVFESKTSYGYTDTTVLFLTLARSCGIPAKFIEGKRIGKSGSYSWAEIFIGGKWVEIDPTQGIEGIGFKPEEESKQGPYTILSESLGPSDSMISSYKDWRKVEKAWDYKKNILKKEIKK